MRLQASNITVKRDAKVLVDELSLVVGGGELVGLIGPNGAGKSTLLEVLAGLSIPDGGHVTLDGKHLLRMSANQRSQQLAWLEQAGPINWPVSVERLITLGRRPHLGSWQGLGPEDQSAVDTAILRTDCTHLREQDATTLSGGERARVLLARALAAEPEILLADEPVAALDIGHQLQTMTLLREFASMEKACLVVLHDLSLASRYCDRLYLMHEGRLVAAGRPDSVLTDANLESVYSVKVARSATDERWIMPVEIIRPD